VLLTFIGCKPAVIKEAEQTLAVADSLRVRGIAPTDSTLWAETVASLTPWRYFYPTDYAKANFYYGYLLRTKSHYPESMQCFIDVTKSCTKEYAWKAKAWTNMGDFCRLEGNYDLAYEMHVHAADCFRRDSNMRAYYYELNNMAVVRAFQKDRNAVQEILSTIERECTDSAVLTKILETRAFLYGNVRAFDSVMYCVNAVLSKGFPVATCYVEKAQAFWWMNQYDSALYYAQIALSHHCSLREKVDMLYITSHNDPTIDSDSILAITSERADLQRILTDQKSQLSHAVEILQQSMKPNYKWVYGAAATLFIIGVILTIILFVTKRHRAAKHAQLKAEEEKHRTLVSKNSELEQKCEVRQTDIQTRLEHECQALRILTDKQFVSSLHWRDYDMMLSTVEMRFYGFIGKLQNYYLTEQNTRLCILLFIDIPKHRMAELLYCSPNSIGKMKERVAEKFGVRGNELHDFLWKMMCE